MLQQEKSAPNGSDWERIGRILSLIAIPVVIAIIGAVIQDTLSRSALSRDYVQLAVSILTTDKTKTPQELREWAVDLLDANSPTKFSKDVADRLKGGEIHFPGGVAALLSDASDARMAVSRDGKLVAIAQNREIRVWDLNTRLLVASLIGDTGDVTCIAFSPTSEILASGSIDQTVRIWDIPRRALRTRLQAGTGPVIGVAFTPDGHLIARRAYDDQGLILKAVCAMPLVSRPTHAS
jgi:WD40 repeat protein